MMDKILWTLAVGFVGAYIAKKRKLNPFFWFAVCFMLGLTALIGLFFFPYFKKKVKKSTPPLQVAATLQFSPQTIWYYLDKEEKQAGPVSFTKLQDMKELGMVDEATYIWTGSFTDWKKWGEVFPSVQT